MARITALCAEALVNYAITSGHLYDEHVALTKGRFSDAAWSLHIADRVVPGYCREFHVRNGVLSTLEKRTVIAELKAYYTTHCAEMA